MTKYTVVWHVDAENALAQVWLDADDRNQVSAAAASIENELAHDAEQKGRPVGDQMHVIHRPPLEVLFEADPLDRMARIVDVLRREAGAE